MLVRREEMALRKDKKREIVSRFRIGTHGGCEALLYEFREGRPFISKEDEPESQGAAPPLGSHAVYIAAATFEEAFTYLLWERSDFKVDRVTCLGLIEMVSGSPLD
jgi:hypothetical protein